MWTLVTLSITAKMLERMRANQKRHYQHWRATHRYQVGDLVLLKKHNADKMDLRWEPNYRMIKTDAPLVSSSGEPNKQEDQVL